MVQQLSINKLFFATVAMLLAAVFAFLVAKGGILVAVAGILIPFVIFFLIMVFKKPETGLWTVIIANYFVLGITRYIPAPLGLSIDFLLVLVLIAVFFKFFHDSSKWNSAKNSLTLLSVIWFAYALFQLVNPETVSREAWFYAMRGVSLYMLLTIPLVLILFRKVKDLDRFIKLWVIFSLLAIFKGLVQKLIGPDPWEQQWLNAGGNVTHVLFGKLRIFSFFTDAGQFGATMGHSGVVFGILAIHTKKFKSRILFGIVAILSIYGLMISGTRGAIAVPFGGFVFYLILQKNLRLIIIGLVLMALVFMFFNYTSIGQNNDEIRRIRTAFDKNNPSFQARLENQARLKNYLSTRPFGGGIGSAGNWGQRFAPQTFLANVPTDSWYVMIWAEQGIVGLILHLFILFFILIKSSIMIMYKIKNKALKIKLTALACGLFGIMLASYGNGILGQMPSGIILYTSMAFLYLGKTFDKEIKKENNTENFNQLSTSDN